MKWYGIAVPIGVMDVGLFSWTRCRRFRLNSVIHKSFPSGLSAIPFAIARRDSTGVIVLKSGET